ncbi:MAG TPA: hypothetical protein VIS07_14065 [Candidatus Binatia bacterium]
MGRRPEETVGGSGGQLVRIDEAVLQDLSHELGNYFHKLYYYTESVASGGDVDQLAAQKLGETVQRLQGFLNTALEYFQPARLNPVAMSAGDVARAIEALFRGEHPEASVEVRCAPTAADASVMVDPPRLSSGLRILARQIAGAGGPGTTLHADLERRSSEDGGVLEIAIAREGGVDDPSFRPSHRLVEWAVAGRMIELHGGQLIANESRPGASGCILTLPLSS